MPKLRRDLREKFSNPGQEKDRLFLLVDPDAEDLRNLDAVIEEGKKRFNNYDFRGYRALKFVKISANGSKKVHCLLWPSFSWLHDTLTLAASSHLPGFKVYDKPRFNFDDGSPPTRFSEKSIDSIMHWQSEVPDKPLVDRSVRQDE